MDRVTNEKTDLTGLESGQADIEAKVDAVKVDTESIETKVDAIQADITVIDSNVDAVKVETDKITQQPIDGLLDINNSLGYRVAEIERHLHANEKWFGKLAVPAGGKVAERMGGTTSAFQLTSGNNAFGSWVQILDTNDTPVASGKTKFDMHRILITSTDSTSPFIIQFVTGESAGIAAKITAENFTEAPYISATNNNDSGIEDVLDRRADAKEKLWARAACIGQNGKILNFYFGIHEYEG